MARALALVRTPELLGSLRKVFGSAHVKLTAMPSADGFRAQLKHENPDVVLLDVTLPRTGGRELLDELRTQFPDLPVMLMTATSSLAANMEPVLAEANVDFVVVPEAIGEVVIRVRRLMARTRVERKALTGVSAHLVPDLHDRSSGRLDARRVSEMFGLPLATVARAVGREPATVHKTPDAQALQEGLAVFERIAAALLRLLGSSDSLRMWLNATHPQLEHQAPVALLNEGRGEVVAELLEDVLHGQPG